MTIISVFLIGVSWFLWNNLIKHNFLWHNVCTSFIVLYIKNIVPFYEFLLDSRLRIHFICGFKINWYFIHKKNCSQIFMLKLDIPFRGFEVRNNLSLVIIDPREIDLIDSENVKLQDIVIFFIISSIFLSILHFLCSIFVYVSNYIIFPSILAFYIVKSFIFRFAWHFLHPDRNKCATLMYLNSPLFPRYFLPFL